MPCALNACVCLDPLRQAGSGSVEQVRSLCQLQFVPLDSPQTVIKINHTGTTIFP